MRVSVVTINRNTGDGAARTAASVRAQSHAELQWVVIDGASSDRSLADLRAAVRPGDILVSEPDRGIADAFNKGLARCDGEAVLFLNAGDTFHAPDSLAALVAAWDRSRFRWITGGGCFLGADGRPLFTRTQVPGTEPRALVRDGCRVIHASTLVERTLFAEVGGFDEAYRLGMDYDLWVRLVARGIAPQLAPLVVADFASGGVSSNIRRRFHEDRRSRAEHGLANSGFYDFRLRSIAMIKGLVPRSLASGGLYRLKERLGW